MSGRQKGFTLIELLAAMAILAVVSVMAVQALSGAIFQRDVLTRIDDDAAELARALSLLRQDLEAVAPVPVFQAGSEPGPAISATAGGLTVMRSGIVALDAAPGSGFGRVDWILDAAGILSRRIAAGEAGQGGAAPSAPLVPVLSGVTGLSLMALGGTLPDMTDPTLLPAGFEVLLSHARHGDIRLVVAR